MCHLYSFILTAVLGLLCLGAVSATPQNAGAQYYYPPAYYYPPYGAYYPPYYWRGNYYANPYSYGWHYGVYYPYTNQYYYWYRTYPWWY